MNDNYMKTILSGVKEWTENLTDDAKDKANNALDKANNALDKANNALDKALFVVNITKNSDGTLSADKTFDEITQAYNEGKYSIVANVNGLTQHLAHFSPVTVSFFSLVENELVFSVINKRNDVFNGSAVLATTDSKLPNPYPLTFTGAVNETYDGSSAKTIEIPSGGGGGGYNDWVLLHSMVLEQDTQYIVKDLGANYNEVRICFENLWCVEGTATGLSIAVNGGSTGLAAQSASSGSFVNNNSYPCSAIIVVRKESDTFSSCTILGINTAANFSGSGVFPLAYNVANGITKVQFSLSAYGTHTMNTGAIIEVWGR